MMMMMMMMMKTTTTDLQRWIGRETTTTAAGVHVHDDSQMQVQHVQERPVPPCPEGPPVDDNRQRTDRKMSSEGKWGKKKR
jgi:hypothetical protein